MRRYINGCFVIVFLGLVACGSKEESTLVMKREGVTESEWQTGIALYSFNHFSFPETLDMSKRAGVKYVEGRSEEHTSEL